MGGVSKSFLQISIGAGAVLACVVLAVWFDWGLMTLKQSVVVISGDAQTQQKTLPPGQSTPNAITPATDSQLKAWSVALRRKLSEGGRAGPEDQLALRSILDKSPLSCRALMDFALSLRQYCDDDGIVAAVFGEVVRHGDRELIAFVPGSWEAKGVLVAMNRTKNTFWRMPVNSDHTYIQLLLVLFNDSIKWISPDDSELQLDLYQAYSGRAECLMLLGELEPALAASEAIPDGVVITDAEKGSRAYGRSLILIQLGRHREAIDFLRTAATVGDRQGTAQRILVDELSIMGRGTEAKDAYADFMRRFHPAAAQAEQYKEKVIIALADERRAHVGP